MTCPKRSTPRQAFGGFAAPSSNTTYTPNQFFDVCLPHRSRGCVRIVAYVLRKTLGWSDANGNPLHEQVAVTYDELIHDAGVSRDSIKTAIAEAEKFGFVRCVRRPSPNRTGSKAVSGLYELRWDEGREYIKNPAIFSGFFAGEGNRTFVPNEYFDVVVRREALSVAKVVGSVARFSIGFVNKFGHRRTHAAMSFADLQRYAKIVDATTLSQAIAHAVQQRYLKLVQPGVFDKRGGRGSTAAIYALRWLSDNVEETNGRKTRAEETDLDQRSENQSGDGQKTRAAERSENPSGLQRTTTKKTLKQQPAPSTHDTADESESAAVSLLKGQGFDDVAARRLARASSVQTVLDQVEWLPLRGVKVNRLGLLRRAIEGNWPKPDTRPRDFGHPKSTGTGDDRVSQLRQRLAYQLKHKPR